MGHLSSTSTSHGRTWGWVMLIGLVLSATTEFFVHRASHTSTADDTPQGYFPKGCVWRLAPGSENLCFWDLRTYEYLDIVTGKWQQEQPAACRLDSELTSHWERGAKYGSDGDSLKSLTTKVRCEKLYCVYWNAWYNNGSWYMLTDLQDHDTVRVAAASGGNQPSNGIVVSKDIEMFHISVKNASLFKDQVESRWIAGQTVLIDFLFFLHPTAIGHWLEHLMPLVSSLRLEGITRPSRLLLLHLKRVHIIEWVRAAIAAALSLHKGESLPPLIMQEEVDSVDKQIGTHLEGISETLWLCFESVLVVKDTYTDGERVAQSSDDAKLFRRNAYRLHGLPQPSRLTEQFHSDIKRAENRSESSWCQITLLRKSANRRIVNEIELVEMLQEFGTVHTFEFTSSTPMVEQLKVMSSTCLLVSAHTSGLANAVYLPPGAAVMELIQRNWVWPNLDLSFKVQTMSLGDVHHWAWRAVHRHEAVYLNPRDEERFGTEEWDGENCDTNECSEAHTNVDVIVDIAAVRAVLKRMLPGVLNGLGPETEEMKMPWPPVR